MTKDLRLGRERLTDKLQRPLRDLRISVTDRCNFRCVYCMPKEVFGSDYHFLEREKLLSFEEIARTLGASDARVFATITLPLARRGIVGGIVLAFARAIGEFGATILVAGDIPGRTTTLALAIYDRVELGKDADAYRLLVIAIAIAFITVWTSEALLRNRALSR